MAELKDLAATSPVLARRLGWDRLREIGAARPPRRVARTVRTR